MRIESEELFECLEPGQWKGVPGHADKLIERWAKVPARVWVLHGLLPVEIEAQIVQRTTRKPIPEGLPRWLIQERWNQFEPLEGAPRFFIASVPQEKPFDSLNPFWDYTFDPKSPSGFQCRWTKQELVDYYRAKWSAELHKAENEVASLRRKMANLEDTHW